MYKIKKQLPNFITLLNLFFGCMAIIALWQGSNKQVYLFIGLALIADLLDGAIARLLKVTSDIGKQLDSLADMVSFGFFPGLVLFTLLEKVSNLEWLPYTAFFVSLFSAIRLARFNIDEKQSDSFIGLPTPANTIWILGLWWYVEFSTGQVKLFFQQPLFLLFNILLSCFLLIANMEMFSFKFKAFKWKGQEIKFVFIVISLAMFAIFRGGSIYWIVCFYIILSILNHFKRIFTT